MPCDELSKHAGDGDKLNNRITHSCTSTPGPSLSLFRIQLPTLAPPRGNPGLSYNPPLAPPRRGMC